MYISRCFWCKKVITCGKGGEFRDMDAHDEVCIEKDVQLGPPGSTCYYTLTIIGTKIRHYAYKIGNGKVRCSDCGSTVDEKTFISDHIKKNCPMWPSLSANDIKETHDYVEKHYPEDKRPRPEPTRCPWPGISRWDS